MLERIQPYWIGREEDEEDEEKTKYDEDERYDRERAFDAMYR